jgi:hypothetical protein
MAKKKAAEHPTHEPGQCWPPGIDVAESNDWTCPEDGARFFLDREESTWWPEDLWDEHLAARVDEQKRKPRNVKRGSRKGGRRA